MPGFDRTGPAGQGSRTGRGLGKCNPKNQKINEQVDIKVFQGELRKRYGRGPGMGFGNETGRGPGRRSC